MIWWNITNGRAINSIEGVRYAGVSCKMVYLRRRCGGAGAANNQFNSEGVIMPWTYQYRYLVIAVAVIIIAAIVGTGK